MRTAHFWPISKYFRYELGLSSDGKYYLVDMGVPFISWFFWLYYFLAPMHCYPISDETAKKLLPKHPQSDILNSWEAVSASWLVQFFDGRMVSCPSNGSS